MIKSNDVTLKQIFFSSQVVATSSNILYNNFMHDLSFDDAFSYVKSCSYYDTPSLISRLNSNKLFLLHIHMRSLQKNFDDLISFCNLLFYLISFALLKQDKKITHSLI